MNTSVELDMWRRAETLFEAALDQPSEERAEFLNLICGGNSPLREIVASLLERDAEDSCFLETPALRPSIGFETDAPEHPWNGRWLGAYRLVRPISAGGMSLVFLGERADGDVEQRVAVKILREEAKCGAELRSIRKERRILTRLDHPNIARSLDGGTTEEGLPYVVLELLEGEPITDFCDGARLDVPHRLKLFRKVCSAVDFAHRHLIVHRDLKPGNILVTAEGEPKLLDFGIAKLLHDRWDAEESALTPTRGRFLTPAYASPEQKIGEPVTIASDIYSLGVVLHELLTGLRPQPRKPTPDERRGTGSFRRPSQVVRRVGARETPTDDAEDRARDRGSSPAQLQRRLAGDLDSILQQCLHGDPQQRYRSVGELERDLRRYLEGRPVIARPPKLSYQLKKLVGRHPVGAPLAGLAVLALSLAGIGLVLQNRQVKHERDRAEIARDRAEVAKNEAEQVTRFLTEAFLLADPHHGVTAGLKSGPDVSAYQVLEYSAQRVRGELAERPLVRARLMHTIGSIFSRLSREGEAEALHKEALEIRRQQAPGDPAAIAESLNGLIFLYVNSGRLEEAEPLADEALAISQQASLAPLLQAEIEANAGMLAFYRGDLDTAEPLFRRALARQQASLPANHRDVNLTRTHLGALLSRKGDSEEAEALLRMALRHNLETEGENHVRAASVAAELAWLLTTRGEHEEAEALFRRGLDILHEQLGAEHRSTLEAHASLGSFLREAGDLAGAEAVMRENLERRRSALPDDHLGILTLLNNLGLVAYDRADFETAEGYFRQALDTATTHFGGAQRDRHTYVRNLGLSLHGQGRFREAEPLLREAVELLAREQGIESPRYGNSLTSLSSVLSALGDFESALDLSLQAEAVLIASLPAGHARIARARGARGAALVGLSRFAEAEALLLESHGALAQAAPQVRLATTRRLCDLYRAWSRPLEAESFCASRD